MKSKKNKKCKHNKCERKAESNGFCKYCIQLSSKECNFCSDDKLINEHISRQELMTICKQPKQFDLNTYWKKTLAVVAIGVLFYVGLMVGMTALTYLLTSFLVEVTVDLVGTIVVLLVYSGIVYLCCRGIMRLSRDLANSKKLRKKK